MRVTLIPNLYDVHPDGRVVRTLQQAAGDMIVLTWLYPRAAHWVLDRNEIHGRVGETLLGADDSDDDQDASDQQPQDDKPRVLDERDIPDREIYCVDLRASKKVEDFVEEVRRIAVQKALESREDLAQWLQGQASSLQLSQYLNPANDAPTHSAQANGNGHAGNGHAGNGHAGNGQAGNGHAGSGDKQDRPHEDSIVAIEEPAARRWYPVIDYARCTNCMECIDFCLFGVYGVDQVETILVEQPDNCRKGCPACSRVCPENAIIFPQHKTPAIAGSNDASASLKIDLSQLFGAPDAVDVAARERDEQLLLAGREAVGVSVGVPKRQTGKTSQPKDELDSLIDELDDLEL